MSLNVIPMPNKVIDTIHHLAVSLNRWEISHSLIIWQYT